MIDDGAGRWPPWSRIPSLKEMAEENGVDFDDLIRAIAEDTTPTEMSKQFGISEYLASEFKDHFYKYGIGSVMGGD